MAFKIMKTCIGCSACTIACSVDAIQKQGDRYIILEEKCIGCGACVSLCPIDAIIIKNGVNNENSNSN